MRSLFLISAFQASTVWCSPAPGGSAFNITHFALKQSIYSPKSSQQSDISTIIRFQVVDLLAPQYTALCGQTFYLKTKGALASPSSALQCQSQSSQTSQTSDDDSYPGVGQPSSTEDSWSANLFTDENGGITAQHIDLNITHL